MLYTPTLISIIEVLLVIRLVLLIVACLAAVAILYFSVYESYLLLVDGHHGNATNRHPNMKRKVMVKFARVAHYNSLNRRLISNRKRGVKALTIYDIHGPVSFTPDELRYLHRNANSMPNWFSNVNIDSGEARLSRRRNRSILAPNICDLPIMELRLPPN